MSLSAWITLSETNPSFHRGPRARRRCFGVSALYFRFYLLPTEISPQVDVLANIYRRGPWMLHRKTSDTIHCDFSDLLPSI